MVEEKLISVKKTIVIAVALAAVAALIVGCGGQPKSPSESGGRSDNDKPAITVEWSPQSDCGTCHAAQKESLGKTELAAGIHATKASATCSTCHNDEAALKSAHAEKTATDTMPTKLDKTTVAVATCRGSGCHDMTNDAFLALTASVTELTDATGKVVNPHSIVGQKGHDEITCANCHVEHAKKTNTDMEYCVTCHHSGKFGTCTECH
ncbi:MAG: hypothetical protein RR671_02420 [Raoultibacter sp.]